MMYISKNGIKINIWKNYPITFSKKFSFLDLVKFTQFKYLYLLDYRKKYHCI